MGVGRGGVCVRGSGGSGETELTPEARGGSGETVFASEPWGSGVPGFVLEIGGVDDLGPVPCRLWMTCSVFCVFYRSPFYGTQHLGFYLFE